MKARQFGISRYALLYGVLYLPSHAYSAESAVTTALKSTIEKGVVASNPSSQTALSSNSATTSSGESTSVVPGTNMSTMILDKLKVSEQITPETTALFGETVDLNTGTLSLQQVDVSIPGNFDIPVEFRRIFRGGRYASFTNLDLGEWAIAIPNINTTIIYDNITSQRFSGNWGTGNMCSGGYTPANFLVGPSDLKAASDYWSGETLDIPGVATERIQVKNFNQRFIKNWRFSCITTTFNGVALEGIKATSPQGITYEFNLPRLIPAQPITGRDGANNEHLVPKYNAFLLVTKITDRFGNHVNYNYTNGELTSITSSDNRTISIAYETNAFQKNRVKSVTASDQTWTYEYKNSTHPLNNDSLISVTRPDSRKWQFDIANAHDVAPGSLKATDIDYYYVTRWSDGGLGGNVTSLSHMFQRQCTLPKSADSSPYNSGYIIHPNGARLDLGFRGTLFGRSEVPATISDYRWGIMRANELCFATYSIVNKKLSGPGLQPMSWTYSYSQNKGGWEASAWGINDYAEPLTGLAATPTGYRLEDLRSTTITSPDGSKTKHVFSRKWDFTDGQEVATESYDTNGTTLLQRVERQFSASPTGGNAGFESFTGPELGWVFQVDNPATHENYINKTKETIFTYKGGALADSYTTDFSNYNQYGVPTRQVEQNSFRPEVRTTETTYTHDLTNWVLNLELNKQVSQGNQSISERSATYFSPNSAAKSLKQTESLFGRQVQAFEYHPFGGLYKTTFALTNRWIVFNDYKRGRPRDIRLPKRYAAGEYVVTSGVNDSGTLAWTYDLNGNRTDYQYDGLSRLTLINPLDPRWEDTGINYVPDVTGRGGLVQNISRGKFRKAITLDGLMQPIVTKEWDVHNEGGTARYVNQQFNAYGKATFTSVPSASPYETFGSATSFDGLQRPISQTNTSNGDITLSYDSNNTTKITNGRGYATSTSYLAYGSPSAGNAVSILQPEGVTTSISYNIANLPTSIVQGGYTEVRRYDTNMNMCLQKRPDTGIKVMKYNVLGQVTGFAEGLSPKNNVEESCENYTDIGTAWSSLTYDNFGDLLNQSYADGTTPTKIRTLDAQGNLTKLTAGDVVWDYSINSAHLVESETLSIDQKTFVIGSSYNSMGYLTQKRYPGGLVIDYTVNGVGEIEAASEGANILASQVDYHPNGQIAAFNYGNGLRFSQTLDTKNRPNERLVLAGYTPKVFQKYQYDNVNNIELITDTLNAARTLSLSYDGLDRLSTASSGIFGNMGYGYDALGNITHKRVYSTTSIYNYDNATNRLMSAPGYNFSYDGRGNVTGNGTRNFTFNRANQLVSSGAIQYAYDGHGRRVKQLKSNQNTYSVYDMSGVLLYRGNPETTHTNTVYLGKQILAELDSGGTAPPVAKPKIGINLSTTLSAGQCSIWDLECPSVRHVYYSWGSTDASTCQGTLNQATSAGIHISNIALSGTSSPTLTQSYPANDALFTLTLTCQGPGGATTESRTVAGTGSTGDEI